MGSSSPTTFRKVESQLEDVFLVIFILNMDRSGGDLHLGTINGKNGFLKSDRTKNGGTRAQTSLRKLLASENVSIFVKFT